MLFYLHDRFYITNISFIS